MTTAALPLIQVQPDTHSFEHLRILADEIRSISRDGAATLVLIGTKLEGVKTMYPQYFDAWRQTELKWDRRAVSQYMRIARDFGDVDWSTAQADAQALLVLTATFGNATIEAVQVAKDVLRNGECLTTTRATAIKRHAHVQAHQARPRHQPRQYVPAYPLENAPERVTRWVTLTEIEGAVRNLQVALVEAYGDNLHPQVRRALAGLQELVK
jgi:hypothetical protein